MTDRARLISAFITPFGLFEWNRLPFGLKNAPQICQRMIDNALNGFTRIPKSDDHGGTLDVFEDGEPVDLGKPSVLGRRSYIDDILIPANNWDQLCDRVEGLLEACDKLNLSISVVKSFWGMPKVEYLDHKANPKDLSALTDLAFPGSLRAMQSFLGSLNYYSRFIEDYAIYASALYKLREIDFAAMMKDTTQAQIQRILEVESADQGSQEDQVIDHRKTLDLEAQDLTEVNPRWIHAYRSFSVLKAKIATTPILRHFDPDQSATIEVYASDWAISGSLMQDYDKIYYHVMFASRTLKSNELNYGIAEKEVLALLRILDLNYNALAGRPTHVLTRHSTLMWLFRSTALQGRLGQWAALLSPWTLEITKCVKGEDEILGALAASITPRSEVDKALISIVPVSREVEAPTAQSSGYAKGLTVNEAEYHGLLLCSDLLDDLDPRRLVICGVSNLVIRQVRGEIDCKASGLTLLRQWALGRRRVTSYCMLSEIGMLALTAWPAPHYNDNVETEDEIQDLVTLKWLDGILVVKIEDGIEQISAVTTRSKARSGVRIGSDPDSLQWSGSDRQAQDEESWILDLKKYLVGEIRDLTQDDAKMFRSIAMNYEVDQSDLLFYCPTTKEEAADRDKLMRLVIPETLQQDILHHYHTSLQ
ncbi:reverse transcriptase, partial [Phytophthora megakarya]